MWLLRSLGLFIAIASLVWVGVLWHWQETHRDMSGTDIAIYLGALPLTLFALVLMARWAWEGALKRAASLASTAEQISTPSTGAVVASAPDDGPGRHAGVLLLASHIKCPAGDTVDALLEAAAKGHPRPSLHEHLRDHEGLPVMAAPVADLATREIEQALLTLQAEHAHAQQGLARKELPEGLLRALALLADPLSEAMETLGAWPQRLAAPAQGSGPAFASAKHRIRVLAAWPPGLTEAEQTLAEAWLTQQLHRLGEGVVDARAWLPPSRLSPHQGQGGPALWAQAEQVLSALQVEGQDDILLLLSCHSDVHADAVEDLERSGRLFRAARPKGQMPGEAAAVLVLACASWPPAQGTTSSPHLHRAAMAIRDQAADNSPRVSHVLATELLAQAVAASGIEAAAVAGLAHDADQHSARAAELFGAMLAGLPHLDAGEDQRMCGAQCGGTGAVGTLLAVAMAARQATTDGRPWAALSLGDPLWRLALVARPATPSSPEDQTKSPATTAGNPNHS
jgi:hypothetical protein